MKNVRPKKQLGQHFLTDDNIAKQIVDSLPPCQTILEIGPGMGVLTVFLTEIQDADLWLIEIDTESVDYLKQHFPDLEKRIWNADFLKLDLKDSFKNQQFAIIGNFPYNISTQILFRVYENRQWVPAVVGMFQREVAMRIASPPGSKNYGILSVLLQAFYDIEYLFTVDEDKFSPPPKVKSGVIRLTRKNFQYPILDLDLFKRVVKTAFNQRRKMLRNSLRSMVDTDLLADEWDKKRPEELSVQQFVELTNQIKYLINTNEQ